MSIEIEKPFVIIVEGKDDAAVIGLLSRHLNLEGVQVFNAQGKDNIRKFVIAIASIDGFRQLVQRVAIIRDADLDPDAARQSCSDSLRAIDKRTEMFLLPGDGPGILEDLCLRTLEGRPELLCVDNYVECIRATGIALRNASKFRIRALLTAMDDGKSRDTEWAAVQGLLDPAHAAFAPLREFLLDFTRA